MIKDAFNKLDSWVMKNGWQGYDPYDIKGTKLFLPLQKNKYATFGSTLLLNRFPMLFRKVFRVKKAINAKAMALFARGYLNCYKKHFFKKESFSKEKFLEKAVFCLNWLIENPSKDYTGFCWGYPFDWQSRVFIPKGTPSGVVTSTAAHAFLDAYEIMKDDKYLNIAKSCCDFILNDLNADEVEEDKICFSYTPIDNYHVHNASLFSASTLLRTFTYIKNEEYKDMGLKAINFTVSYQNEDGSWYYWAPPDKLIFNIDNYHTGFVLECLNICRRALKGEFEFEYERELRRGLEFYANNLFLDDGTPKLTNESVYPVDIHSCAQAIITFCELADFEPKYLRLAEKVAEWSIKNMQDEEGFFYYRIYKNYVDRMPYIRWGQAWMLRGLSYIEL
jgi:rhamnogalacturonyl hydrolase YesR